MEKAKIDLDALLTKAVAEKISMAASTDASKGLDESSQPVWGWSVTESDSRESWNSW